MSYQDTIERVTMSEAIVSSEERVAFDKEAALDSSTVDTLAVSDRIYDSGWRYDTNSRNHQVTFSHSLGRIPYFITVLFSADQRTVFPITWSWEVPQSGNPVTISMSSNQVTLNIWAGGPLHGVWTPGGGWLRFNDGFWRVILM